MSGENTTTHKTDHVIQTNMKTGMNHEGEEKREATLMSDNERIKTPSGNDLEEIESPDSIHSPYSRQRRLSINECKSTSTKI